MPEAEKYIRRVRSQFLDEREAPLKLRQRDKREIYFRPDQLIKLKQHSLQTILGDEDNAPKKHFYSPTPVEKRPNISAVVRAAVDDYLDTEGKIATPDIIPLEQRSCWAYFDTMNCLRKNFDKMSNRERASDIMDILDELMERGRCWGIPGIAREAERVGARNKKYRLHTRNVVEEAAHRKEEERLGIKQGSARSRMLGPTAVDALGIPKGTKLPVDLELEFLRERIRVLESKKKKEKKEEP